MANVSTVAEAEEAVRERTAKLARRDQVASGGRTSQAPQAVGGRLFVDQDGVWTDAGHRSTVEVVEVAAFSDAYFALVRAIPELTPYLTVGDSVMVAGKDITIRIADSGETTMSPGRIGQTARRFRGL